MDITVLAKIVDDLGTLAPRKGDGLSLRSEASAFLNPFDQRALRAAVELRRPGERLTLVSMGPAYAEGLLAPYRTTGVDRILLLSDARLQGADVVVTARALSRVVRPLGPQIILCGERATDSQTGVIAAALSPLLGLPAVTAVRSILRDASGSVLTVTADTPRGWARSVVRAPCIVSVSEKIARPLKPAAGGLAGVDAVERITVDALGDGPLPLWDECPRTRVVRWQEYRRTRALQIFDAPGLEDGLSAIRASRNRALLEDRSSSRLLVVAAEVEAPDRELLVLVTGHLGTLDPASLAVISELRSLLPRASVSAVWVGPPPPRDATQAIQTAGAAQGYAQPARGAVVRPDAAAGGLEAALGSQPDAAAVIVPDGIFGRHVAGHLASRIDRGIVTDVETVAEAGGVLEWTKPSFGSRGWATVVTGSTPSVVVMCGGHRAPARRNGSEPFPWTDLLPGSPSAAVEPLDAGREVGPEFGSLDSADVVVGIGMGVGGPGGIAELLPPLAAAGAALAATRRVVDAGWVPPQLQVGLTGRSLAPRVGVLVGASGAANFMIGWRRAHTLVAINTDPNAPVFSQVDVGFVGRWEDLLPRVLAATQPVP